MGYTDEEYRKYTKVPLHTNIGRIEKIKCGYSHTIIFNEKMEIFGCGYNSYG